MFGVNNNMPVPSERTLNELFRELDISAPPGILTTNKAATVIQEKFALQQRTELSAYKNQVRKVLACLLLELPHEIVTDVAQRLDIQFPSIP